MSLLQLPDSLRIWNNDAFDDGASASKISSAPPPLREVSTNSFAPLDLDPSKENRGPEAIRPLLDAALSKKAAPRVSFRDDAEVNDTALDDEISRIEEEIARLHSRLEALRAKKAERESRGRQPRGRIVPAKFMNPKQGVAARNPCTPASKRMDRAIEVAPSSAWIRRRGVSLGPLEILATPARPIGERPSPAKNLWPSALKKKTEECPAPIKKSDHQSGKVNETPIGTVQSQPPATATKMTTEAKQTLETPDNASNRRRAISLGPDEIVASARFRRKNSLQEHTDKSVDKQSKRSSSISPISPKPSAIAKKQVIGGAEKGTKEGPFHGIIEPKSLFQDNQSSTGCKRPLKADKQGNKRAKWSLPELSRRKTTALLAESSSWSTPKHKRNQGSELEDQMKTDSYTLDNLDVVVSSLSFIPNSPKSIMKLAAMLPKIKTLRCNTESPRDSGCAKRAAQLVRRQPFFDASEDEALNSPTQALLHLSKTSLQSSSHDQ